MRAEGRKNETQMAVSSIHLTGLPAVSSLSLQVTGDR
jgi:hypothetical protein